MFSEEGETERQAAACKEMPMSIRGIAASVFILLMLAGSCVYSAATTIKQGHTAKCIANCDTPGTYTWKDVTHGISLQQNAGSSANDFSIGSLALGTQIKLTVSTANGAANSINTLTVIPDISVACPSATTATVGTAYSSSAAASGNPGANPGYYAPITYSIATGSIPANTLLDSSSGAITGYPTQTGTSTFTVKATDNHSPSFTGTSPTCTITVSAAPTITVTCPTATATSGAAYSSSATASGGTAPYTYTSTASLPYNLGPGMTTAGAITGTPYSTGTYTFTVTATDHNGVVGTKSCSIVISSALVTTCPTATGTVGTAYSSTIAASGGSGSGYTYSITSGTPPSGITRSGASFTGIPLTAQASTFTVQVTDSASNSYSRSCTITISPAASTLSIACPTATARLHTAYSSSAAASGGSGSYSSYGLASGSLPTGLSLNTGEGSPELASGSLPSGTISLAGSSLSGYSGARLLKGISLVGGGGSTPGDVTGTPSETGTYTFKVSVTDSLGATATTPTCTIAVTCSASGDCVYPPADAACYNSPGTCSGGTCSYTPKASSTPCSTDPHCNGDAYYLGYVCNGAGSCNVNGGADGCCADSFCTSHGYGDYCDLDYHLCWSEGGGGGGGGGASGCMGGAYWCDDIPYG